MVCSIAFDLEDFVYTIFVFQFFPHRIFESQSTLNLRVLVFLEIELEEN
jgi:hypothetical protein